MNLKVWMRRIGGIFVALLVLAPALTIAQGYGSDRTQKRGMIQIENNWRDTVHITVWTNRGEELGGGWEFSSGESAFLAVGSQKIKVRPNYQIKVGNDWGRVSVRDAGRYQNGVWYINVRDLWRITHRGQNDDRNRYSGQNDDRGRYSGQRNAPDYLK